MNQEKNSGLLFSERLRSEMNAKEVTQDVLAKKVGVTQGAVSGWLRGAVPRIDKLDKISNCLGVTVSWLLSGEGSRENFTNALKADAALAEEMKDKVNPSQIIFDLLTERRRTERLEKEVEALKAELQKLKKAAISLIELAKERQ